MDFGAVFLDIYPMLLDGLVVTIEVSLISLAIAFVLGLISSVMGLSKFWPISFFSKAYVLVIRGTPFIVQLFIIKYGIPQLIKNLGYQDFKLSILQASIAALALNAGAYMSEIFRGGIEAVDIGQMEAAQSLGLPKSRAMLKVVLPQALKISIPSLANQFIITLKDSSLAQVIGLNELFYEGKRYVGRTFKSFETYVLVGCVYFIIITVLSMLIRRLERKLQYGKKS